MKTSLLSILILLLSFTFINAKENESLYISNSIYDSIKKEIPLPPKENSKEQKTDETEILKLQKARTAAECEQANIEGNAELKPMFGLPKGPLTDAEIETVSSLLGQVRSDIGFFISTLKKDLPRKRPFVYMTEVNPCLPKDDSGAYPSGHGTLGKIYAMVLSDIYPAYKAKLEIRGKEIGQNRVIGGVHHPSDIQSGRKLAELLYKEIKKSKKYQEDLANVRAANSGKK